MRSSSKRFTAVMTILFAALTALLIAHHEMWRDELQAWLIARDSPTFSSFLYALRYEGVPPLWHFLVRLLTRVSSTPFAMQGLQVGIGTFWAYLLSRRAPFPRWMIVLLVFGYYVVYQYTVIARNYGLGLVFLTLACVDFEDPEKTWRVGLWLALASWTSVMALIVAAGLAAAHVVRHEKPGSAVIYLMAAVVSVLLMVQPQDALFPSSPGWILHLHIARLKALGEAITTAYLLSPVPQPRFWENPWIHHFPGFSTWGWLAGMLILAAAGRLCGRTRTARVMFWIATVGLLAFSYTRYIGYARHQGFLFFTFIFAYWLTKNNQPSGERDSLSRWTTIGLGLILGFQVYGSALAAFYDFGRPFSCGKEVARYLVDSGLNKQMLAAGPDYLGVPVVGYLHQPFYSAQGDRWQTFTRWDLRRIEMFDDREFIRRARAAARQTGRDIVMMTDHPMDPAIERATHAQFLQAFTGSLVGDEDYYLYRIRRED